MVPRKLVLNPEKCHFMSQSKNKKDKDNCLDLGKVTLASSPKVTLLGIIIDLIVNLQRTSQNAM